MTRKQRTSRAQAATPIVVTTENFGDLLIEGAREAVAVARGELEPARIQTVTARGAAAHYRGLQQQGEKGHDA